MTWERSDVAAALAAVDDPAGTGDPGGAGRGKEGDDGGNFFGRAETAERNVLPDEAGHAFGVFLLPLLPGPAGRRDCPRGGGVHADGVGRVIEGDRLGV